MFKEVWSREIPRSFPFKDFYREFLYHLDPLGFELEDIQGNVLVIGSGPACPKRTLIATPTSEFQELRPKITSVFFCDPELPLNFDTLFTHPVINTAMLDRIPQPSTKTIYYELNTSYYFLERVPPDFFDTILMFRAVDTGQQITEMNLIGQLAPHLKPNGLFICSGGRFPEQPQTDLFLPLSIIKLVRLSNYSDGYLFANNMGAILKRPPKTSNFPFFKSF